MSNIRQMPAATTFTPELALRSALDIDFNDVIAFGYDADGALIVRSSRMSRADALFLTELLRDHILDR